MQNNQFCITPEALGLCPISSLPQTHGKQIFLLQQLSNELNQNIASEKKDSKSNENVQDQQNVASSKDEQHEQQQQNNVAACAQRKRRIDLMQLEDIVTVRKSQNPTYMHSNKMRANFLNNFLSSSVAYKWLLCEWFDSYLDKALLSGKNSFQKKLTTMMPKLQTRNLIIFEWSHLRSMMGKPRRFSSSFVLKERYDLERKRMILRLLQNKSVAYVKDLSVMVDIPDKIPRVLPKGTLISAILRTPFQGSYCGTVQSYNADSWCYNIRFFKLGISEKIVPDYEIVALNYYEILNIQGPIKNTNSNGTGYYEFKIGDGETINGYAVRDLKNLLKLKRTVELHTNKIQRLVLMNNEAKLIAVKSVRTDENNDNDGGASSSDDDGITDNNGKKFRKSTDFQRKYAAILLAIEKVDRDMLEQIDEMEKFKNELEFISHTTNEECAPHELYQKCRAAASAAIERNDNTNVKSIKIRNLMNNLVLCLKLIQTININNNAAYVLDSHLSDMKSKIKERNLKKFEEGIEANLCNIRLCLENSKLAYVKTKYS